jgi:signal peptidase I
VTETSRPLAESGSDRETALGVDVAGTHEPSDAPGQVAPPDDPPRSGLSPGARAFFDWVVVVGVALLVAIVVRTFLLAHFVVEGTSMYSTLDSGDRVFVNKLSYHLHDPNRGDVVVLHELTGAAERDLIKRVIGLPGDEIEMSNCEVRIDGALLQEPYLDPTVVTPGRCGDDIPAQVVDEGHVFVMGDNRAGSQDSRALGQISFDDLVGRAFVVFWPRDDWQWL